MNLPIIVGQLQSGLCFNSYQEMVNAFGAIMSVSFNESNGAPLIVSATKPDTSYQGNAEWLRLDSSGRPERRYWFAQGAWLALHPFPPGFSILWNRSLPDFTSYDGGDSNPLSDISGPMWQLMNANLDGSGDQALVAKVPIGVGTLPSTKVINVNDTGGEETHSLTQTEMPPHNHNLANGDSIWNSALNNGAKKFMTQRGNSGNSDSNDYELQGSGTTPSVGLTGDAGGVAGVVAGHNTLPPYQGVYFLQRTSRLFYAVS